MSVHAVDLTVIVAYLVLMLYLGYRGWKLAKTSTDYLVAGRRLGYGMYIGCLSAVALGGASTIGGTKLVCSGAMIGEVPWQGRSMEYTLRPSPKSGATRRQDWLSPV